jgi:hypothetical protein
MSELVRSTRKPGSQARKRVRADWKPFSEVRKHVRTRRKPVSQERKLVRAPRKPFKPERKPVSPMRKPCKTTSEAHQTDVRASQNAVYACQRGPEASQNGAEADQTATEARQIDAEPSQTATGARQINAEACQAATGTPSDSSGSIPSTAKPAREQQNSRSYRDRRLIWDDMPDGHVIRGIIDPPAGQPLLKLVTSASTADELAHFELVRMPFIEPRSSRSIRWKSKNPSRRKGSCYSGRQRIETVADCLSAVSGNNRAFAFLF